MRTLSDAECAILRELSGSIPEGPRPYAVIAERAGLDELDEKSVLGIIRGLMARGVIRRMAAVLHDRKLGYEGNAMVVWCVEPRNVEQAGAAAAARPEISHTYARKTTADWPYNLYTMVHARSRDEVAALVEELCPLLGASGHRVLFTLREFTKRPPYYASLWDEAGNCGDTTRVHVSAADGREMPRSGSASNRRVPTIREGREAPASGRQEE